jgi:hypothetical protein
MRQITDTAGDDPTPKKAAERRMVAIVLAFVGAACLIVASFSKSWMGNDNFGGLVRDPDAKGDYWKFRGDIRFGPLGFEQCAKPYRGFEFQETPSEVTCRTLSTSAFNAEVGEVAKLDREKYTSGAFSPAGWLAFATCLLSALGLLASAGLALARQRKELPISPASVALLGIMGAMASGCVFIATKPGPAGMLGVDLGFWAFGVGTVVGILAAQMLAKEIRPVDPDLLADALSPDDFAAFPIGRGAQAPSAVPVPLPEVPPTQPVEALTDEQLGLPGAPDAPGAPAAATEASAAAPEADSPDGAKKPDEVSS